MLPGIMAVKSNFFALPVAEGEWEQELLRPRCPWQLGATGHHSGRTRMHVVMG